MKQPTTRICIYVLLNKDHVRKATLSIIYIPEQSKRDETINRTYLPMIKKPKKQCIVDGRKKENLLIIHIKQEKEKERTIHLMIIRNIYLLTNMTLFVLFPHDRVIISK